jgi:hypothetical protein
VVRGDERMMAVRRGGKGREVGGEGRVIASKWAIERTVSR